MPTDTISDRQNSLISGQTTYSESPKPLNLLPETADPHPSPVDNSETSDDTPDEAIDWTAIEADYEAGRIGYDFRSGLRMPATDEYIDEDGQIAPPIEQFRSRKKRHRALSEIETIDDVRREMTRLYADFHHRRISPSDFTRSAYALDCLSRMIRMDIKCAQELARGLKR